MAYNTTSSLDKLTCTDYVDFRKFQDRFGRFSLSKNDSKYLDIKLKVFEKDDNKEFQLVQNLTMGEANFNQYMQLRNQLVNAAENFAREENLTPMQIPTMSKDMDEQQDLCDSAPLQSRQAWETLCSSPTICKEEGGREVSKGCLCEL